MARKQANNKRLLILTVLLAVVIVLLFILPDPTTPVQQPAEPEAAPTEIADLQVEDQTIVHAGDMAPDFRVEMFDGTTFTLSSLRGKVVWLNFWATGCPPCREELSRVQAEVIDRFAAHEDFVFLPISRGETREEVAAFREKTGHAFAMGLDPEEQIFSRYAQKSIPRNYLIDREGRVIATSLGYEPEEFDALLEQVANALNVEN